MRIRESGMPAVELWRTFFAPRHIIDTLGITKSTGHVVEFGCGYGTFTLPAAQTIAGKITAFELDPAMLEHAKSVTDSAGLQNIDYRTEDFFNAVETLGECSADFIMLFNILHGQQPQVLLAEAFALLIPGGKAGIIHWNYDPDTPRGPPMSIRPKPDSLAALARATGFLVSERIDLPPYHYGFKLTKPTH